MSNKYKKAIHSLKYFSLSFLVTFLQFSAFIGLVTTPVLIAIAFSYKTEKYFHKPIGGSIGWLIGLLTAFILFLVVNHFFNPYLEKLKKYVKKFKSYTFEEKYEEDMEKLKR